LTETFPDYLQHKQFYEYREKELLKLRDLPAETVDGQRILLKGNVEFIEEVPSIKKHGGEGIGLYRTEMLFLGRSTIPDEEEQFRTYVEIVRQMAPYPVTIRTLDVGAKFVSDLNLDEDGTRPRPAGDPLSSAAWNYSRPVAPFARVPSEGEVFR
jgi:phosphotransferase system enzyme I (PtsI)